MFGGLAFMTRGRLTVGVYGDGLIARIGAGEMGAATGRPMRGIIVVAGEMLGDRALGRWIGKARSYIATLPPTQPHARQGPLRQGGPGRGGRPCDMAQNAGPGFGFRLMACR